MKQPILIILFFLMISLTASRADACLNPIGRFQVGKRIKVDGVSAQDFARDFVSHEDRKYWEKVKADIERRKKAYPYIDNRNNLAVALIHLGDVKNAIAILEELETKTPGQYVTAANLGTAYELNGENQKALDWIKQGINRKSESHYGTEWLHVKILETKLAMEKDANWLNNHSVLEMDFGNGDVPQQPNKLTIDYL
jgi:tetratricopeptide (TPR) repeat protein